MKKFISFLCILSILASFTSCTALNPKYKDVAEMQADLIGTWTSSDGHEQIIIASDKIDYVHRNENYEDNTGSIAELFWDHKEGIIDSLQTESPFTVSEDYQTIMWLGNIYSRGGELVENPLPKDILVNAISNYKYTAGMWSAKFSTICDNIVREISSVTVYKPGEHDDFSYLQETINEYEGNPFIVTLEGEVSMMPTVSHYYTEPEEFAKFLIIVNENQAVSTTLYYTSEYFESSAIVYFSESSSYGW